MCGHVANINVDIALAEIRAKSEILSEMETEGTIKMIGGMYDIETGLVTFN